MTVGSKAQVWHGNADKTTGGLEKKNLMKNKHGRIVSKKKHNKMKNKKTNPLFKAGFVPKKGTFKLFKKSDGKKKVAKKTAKKRSKK